MRKCDCINSDLERVEEESMEKRTTYRFKELDIADRKHIVRELNVRGRKKATEKLIIVN